MRYSDKDEVAIYRKRKMKKQYYSRSGSIVRLSMAASRVADPGPNPGRSTILS